MAELKAENERLRQELELAKWAFEGLRADRMAVLGAMQDEMKLVDLVCAIAARQLCGFVPPLRCGIDSGHNLLVPERDHNRIILRCLDCDFRQENWPGQV